MNILRYTWQLSLFCCVSLGAALASAGGDSKAFKHTPSEEKVFELTNAERKKENVSPLKLNADLSKIARAHSENMARQKMMEHMLDGKTPFDRIKATGLRYFFAGENIASGPDKISMPMVMEGWMNSKRHRENILGTEFTEIGIGIASDAAGQVYFTQLFAKLKAKE